ncbi:cyclic pyranopterin monophosphate synthase MoaC [Bacteriovoracaceae bacterium]|nr:cyclic pyranopterin monophosphate synthase MoaC [Bacteriovoracaceae bacterium]
MEFTHVDENNNPSMVGVGSKGITERIAHAQCEVKIPQIIVEKFDGKEVVTKKGPVFASAIFAGTQACKKTSELIPFCHQLLLESCKFHLKLEAERGVIVIDCVVKTHGKTGVEMEALCGVNIAALTIYDMCKALSHDIVIGEIKLMEKSGGKRDFKR